MPLIKDNDCQRPKLLKELKANHNYQFEYKYTNRLSKT